MKGTDYKPFISISKKSYSGKPFVQIRMGIWRTICVSDVIKEVLHLILWIMTHLQLEKVYIFFIKCDNLKIIGMSVNFLFWCLPKIKHFPFPLPFPFSFPLPISHFFFFVITQIWNARIHSSMPLMVWYITYCFYSDRMLCRNFTCCL